ncbi:MAG: hypothetical protein ACK559_40650, partial [bacterium]
MHGDGGRGPEARGRVHGQGQPREEARAAGIPGEQPPQRGREQRGGRGAREQRGVQQAPVAGQGQRQRGEQQQRGPGGAGLVGEAHEGAAEGDQYEPVRDHLKGGQGPRAERAHREGQQVEERARVGRRVVDDQVVRPAVGPDPRGDQRPLHGEVAVIAGVPLQQQREPGEGGGGG